MCDIDFNETAAVFKTVYRTARKQHRCNTCRCMIQPRDRYLTTTVIVRGDPPDVSKACAVCAAMWEDFKASHDYYYASDSLWDMLEGCVDRMLRSEKKLPSVRVAFYAGMSEQDKKWRRYMAIIKRRRYRNKEVDG